MGEDEYDSLVDVSQRVLVQEMRANSSNVRNEPMPWMYWAWRPGVVLSVVVARSMSPPSAPPVSSTDDDPPSMRVWSMRNEGIVEKSVIPSIGELRCIPFQVTCVWDGDVPRNDTVESDARPAVLTKTGVLNVRMSAIDCDMFSLRARESMVVLFSPMSLIGRAAVVMISRRMVGSAAVAVRHKIIEMMLNSGFLAFKLGFLREESFHELVGQTAVVVDGSFGVVDAEEEGVSLEHCGVSVAAMDAYAE